MNIRQPNEKSGVSLIEVSVVVILLVILAAFGVPRMQRSVERAKAMEAFEFLSAVRASQDLYQSRKGTFSTDFVELDLKVPVPQYFFVGSIAVGNTGKITDSWTLTLTRQGASSSYGDYTVTFNQDGYDVAHSTLEARPEVNPHVH